MFVVGSQISSPPNSSPRGDKPCTYCCTLHRARRKKIKNKTRRVHHYHMYETGLCYQRMTDTRPTGDGEKGTKKKSITNRVSQSRDVNKHDRTFRPGSRKRTEEEQHNYSCCCSHLLAKAPTRHNVHAVHHRNERVKLITEGLILPKKNYYTMVYTKYQVCIYMYSSTARHML